MKYRRVGILVGLSIALAGVVVLCDRASADWELRAIGFHPDGSTDSATSSGIFGTTSHAVSTDSDGVKVTGSGFAFDTAIGDEAFGVAVANGLQWERWRWYGPGEGYAEMEGSADITGAVTLLDDDCAAAALGYCKLASNLFLEEIVAELTASTGATVSDTTVHVAVAGPGIGIPVTDGSMEQEFPDHDYDEDYGEDCTNLFVWKARSRARISVWANATLGAAACLAGMSGFVEGEYLLEACPADDPVVPPAAGGEPVPAPPAGPVDTARPPIAEGPGVLRKARKGSKRAFQIEAIAPSERGLCESPFTKQRGKSLRRSVVRLGICLLIVAVFIVILWPRNRALDRTPASPSLARAAAIDHAAGASQSGIAAALSRAAAAECHKEALRTAAGVGDRMRDLGCVVEVAFIDDGGAPISGVGALLLAPSGIEPPHSWPAIQSDAHGIARWAEIPEGVDYRWELQSELPFSLDPPAEESFVQRDDSTIRPNRGHSSRRSGPFALREGETARFVATSFAETIVRGAVPRRAGCQNVVLTISHRSTHEGPNGQVVVQIHEEQSLRVESGGDFLFRGVRPGMKTLSGYWREQEGHFFFLDTNFELTLGEDRDLGIVQPAGGHAIDLVADLFGAQAGSDGALEQRVFRSAEVFAAERPAHVLLYVDSAADPVSTRTGIAEGIAIPLGERVRLHGLTAGECSLWLSEGTDFPPAPREGFELEFPRLRSIDIPYDGTLVMPVWVREQAEMALAAQLPAGMRGSASASTSSRRSAAATESP